MQTRAMTERSQGIFSALIEYTKLIPALVEIVRLHSPHTRGTVVQCHGCDPGTGTQEYPAWPCSTIKIIAHLIDREEFS